MKTKMKASQNKKCFFLFFFPNYFNFRQCLSDCVFGCTWSHLEADVMNWRLVVQQLAVRRNEKNKSKKMKRVWMKRHTRELEVRFFLDLFHQR